MKHETFQDALWWMCLLVAPLVLLGIELFHPANFTADPGMYAYLSVPQAYQPAHQALGYFGPQWWFVLHMIQTPMMALVGVGVWLLVGKVGTDDGSLAVGFAWLARLFAYVFLIYYTVLDAVGGIGLGRTIVISQAMLANGTLSAHQLQGVAAVLNATWVDHWAGGVGSVISHGASWAAFGMAATAALARFFARQGPWPALVLLAVAGWVLQLSHAAMHGPEAFALLIMAAMWLRYDERRATAEAAKIAVGGSG